MERVVRSFAAFAGALDRPRSLRETMTFLEGELARELTAERVTIELGELLPAPPDRDVEALLVLSIHGASFGRVRIHFATAPEPSMREALGALAAPIAAVLALRSQSGERERLHELVRTDALTGLPNRMAFDERLRAASFRTRSRGLPLTVALLDIDYFKTFNDLYGHVEGDRCLRSVATSIAGAAGAGAFVARFGGEEFAFVSESLDPSDAASAIERIVRVFEEPALLHEGSTLRRISISAGVVCGIPESADFEAFVREADAALYRAKGLGRNRLCYGTYVSAAPIAARHARALFGVPASDDGPVERQADLARVLAALRQSRMLSLVGPSGIGKSRLAHVTARAMQHVAAGGIAYVDLAQTTSRFDPIALMRAALDDAAPATDLSETLRDLVTKPEALLLVDNVPEAGARDVAELCNDLLRASPNLTILTTSRAALGCLEERVMVVAPLVTA